MGTVYIFSINLIHAHEKIFLEGHLLCFKTLLARMRNALGLLY